MRGLTNASGFFCAVILLCVPVPSLAQDNPAGDIAGGYSFTRDFRVKENLPLGWFASGAYNITDWLAAVGEIGESTKKFDFSVDSDTFSTTTRLQTFLGGARHARRLKGTTPFAQVLVGVARETGGVAIFRPSIATPQTKLTLQPGGGIDVPATDRISVRLAADYRRIFARRENTDQEDSNQIRIAAGLVVGIGSR